MNKTKLLALLLVLAMCFSTLVSCFGGEDNGDGTGGDKPGEGEGNKPDDGKDNLGYDPADVVSRTDFTSVYEMIGSKVTIDMVEEKDGLAFVTVDGVEYELGMDFLSMAMVYNVSVPENHAKYKTADDVYNEWFKLYTLRWNYLVAEVPLYSNDYYDLYNAKIENFKTTPFWGPADAIIAATIAGENTSVILGSATDLSGAFRSSSWGKSSPGASDLDIENLTSGYATIMTSSGGAPVYNMAVLAEEPTVEVDADGNATYTITIKEGLKFSDGSDINAKHYIAGLLSNSTAVAVEAGGTGASGLYFVGYDEFKAYTGANDGATVEDVKASKWFTGVKLLGDYTFSVTIDAEYANYYYAFTYASFAPSPLALYLGNTAEIVVDEATKACGLSAAYYNQVEQDGKKTYTTAAEIVANLKWNSDLPWSGPYVVSDYKEDDLQATLTLNPYYPGDIRGKATINTITYIKVETETQMDKFTQGEVDVIAGITGGAETQAALKVVNENPTKYKETHYARAGYGKMGFRGDYGSTQFRSVRQAIMYTLNRNEFAQAFTGGFGSIVHGAYYTDMPAYQANKDAFEDEETGLQTYAFSVDNAKAVLIADGWIYNEKGEAFDATKDAVRYKKLSGYELSAANLGFKSVDQKYKTVKVGNDYYLPLVVNWYGTQPNDVTDLLKTSWAETNAATKDIGMYITYTSCDFNSGLYGEYLQIPSYGFDGVPKLSCINFATGFNSAIYDFSWNWTIDPDLYDDYSQYYIKDEADFYADYQK